MHTRRITFALGAAGGGLLAAAFMSTAVAFADVAASTADVFGFAPLPDSPETVAAISGFPPLYQQVEGDQTFAFFGPDPASPTTSVDYGQVDTDVSTLTTSGFTNTEILLTDNREFVELAPIGAVVPGEGSVYDIASFAGFTNEYSDVVGGTLAAPTDTITDTLVTPLGSINLSPLFEGFATSVNPNDLFVITADPSLVNLLESVLGTFSLY